MNRSFNAWINILCFPNANIGFTLVIGRKYPRCSFSIEHLIDICCYMNLIWYIHGSVNAIQIIVLFFETADYFYKVFLLLIINVAFVVSRTINTSKIHAN